MPSQCYLWLLSSLFVLSWCSLGGAQTPTGMCDNSDEAEGTVLFGCLYHNDPSSTLPENELVPQRDVPFRDFGGSNQSYVGTPVVIRTLAAVDDLSEMLLIWSLGGDDQFVSMVMDGAPITIPNFRNGTLTDQIFQVWSGTIIAQTQPSPVYYRIRARDNDAFNQVFLKTAGTHMNTFGQLLRGDPEIPLEGNWQYTVHAVASDATTAPSTETLSSNEDIGSSITLDDATSTPTPTSSGAVASISSNEEKAGSFVLITVASFASFVVILLLCIVFFLVVRMRKSNKPAELADVDYESGQELRQSQSNLSLPISADRVTYSPLPTAMKKKFDEILSWDMPIDELIIGGAVGEGAYGQVFRGRFRGNDVAVKQLKQDATEIKEADLEDFKQEAMLMKGLRPHKNVLSLIGIVSLEKHFCIVTEMCESGSLLELFEDEIKPKIELKIIKGITAGLVHLHKEGIVHRDMAARNILLTEDMVPKISDFGLARLCPEATTAMTQSEVGPLKWMSPESISAQLYSTKSDVWSYGILLIEIFTRQEPYPSESGLPVATKVAQGKLVHPIPDHVPEFFKELLNKCFQFEAEDRPSMADLLKEVEKLTSMGYKQEGE